MQTMRLIKANSIEFCEPEASKTLLLYIYRC